MDKYNRKNAEMKKYHLALKNRIYNDTSSKLKKNQINEKINENKLTNNYDSMDSQNIKLRISDSFAIEDSDEEFSYKLLNNNRPANKKNQEIIIISDSSEDERSLESNEKPKLQGFQSCLKPKTYKNQRNSSTGLESIDLSDEDSDIFTGSMQHKQSSENRLIKNPSRTSEETNFDDGVDETMSSIVETSLKISEKPQVTPIINRNLLGNIDKTITKKFTPGPTKLSEITTPISRSKAKDIMRLIKSKKIESPVVPRKIIESSDDEIVTDDEQQVQHPAWIDESDDAEEIEVLKPSKTHVTRFLNPPVDELSEEKKRQISSWLLSNPADSRSQDSISAVSPSLKNSSLTSGNSSLDRLEMNYETPNNRDRFRGTPTIRKQNDVAKSKEMQTPRQTVMDEFMKKDRSKKKNDKFESPLLPKSKATPVTAMGTPQAVVGDVADILDELYGETWRQRIMLPSTEPRRAVILQDRSVQTEKIKKTKKVGGSSDVKKFIRDITPGRPKKENRDNYSDSFINDSTDSEDGDTTYATAVTHPRISGEKNLKKGTPISANTLKAIQICDSDSDDDNFGKKHNKDNKRRLSFSDEDDSSTSEYDPEDFVPPKPVLPKTINKADEFKQNLVRNKCKGFLASLSGSVPMEHCHPEAKKYRTNFQKNREELVKKLYRLYNEKIFDNKLPRDMLIEWNVRMRGTAGLCYNKRLKNITGITRISRMVLATKVLDRADRVRDTLVHEMCHAAAWIFNDVCNGHGPHWKSWASKAMRVFPELPPINRCHNYEISTKFTYRCVQCGYSFGRHSKSLNIEKRCCGRCHGKFEILLNRVTKSGTKIQIPRTPKAQPTGFALFVKENYSTLKKQRRNMRHKEVMQLLGQQFSAIKLTKKNDNEPNSSENSN